MESFHISNEPKERILKHYFSAMNGFKCASSTVDLLAIFRILVKAL